MPNRQGFLLQVATPMLDLTNFTLRDMTACGMALRKLGAQARNMEQAAEHITRFLYDNLIDPQSREPACALVRFFKTYPYSRLSPELSAFAERLLDGRMPSPGMKCLTLVATAGSQPSWNSRQASVGHQAIPLPSADLVVRMPMISQLLHQFGLEVEALLEPHPELLMDLEQRTYNVFHVAEALGSPYLPAQADFVKPFGIRSVLGFGGVLPSGNLFAVILFARVPIPRETAELFKPLALSTKLAILPFTGDSRPGDAEVAAGEKSP
jgi:hypothetical protein